MHLYEIYEHERYGLRAVKQGFSWWAFLAPSVWAAALGLGRLTFTLVIASTLLFDVLDLTAGFINDPFLMGAMFVLAYALFGLRPGVRGYRWVGTSLKSDGWVRRCSVVAESRRLALRAVRTGRAVPDPTLLSAASGA